MLTATTTAAPKTLQEILAEEAAQRAEWEKATYHKGYPIAQLRRAFDRVTAKMDNWKGRIQATVSARQFDQVKAAVEYFAGSPCHQAGRTIKGGRLYYQIDAPGYYASCGA